MSQDNPVRIVAEIGVNHNNDMEVAVSLIDWAKSCGCDFVKFQTWRKGRWPDIEHLRLSDADFIKLIRHCVAIDMPWFSTAFDMVSIDSLAELGQLAWKIPSGLSQNTKYLDHVFSQQGEFIFSTGGLDGDQVVEVMNRPAVMAKAHETTFLHCVSEYPPEYESVNLRSMLFFGDIPFGISDHTPGIEVPIAAVALGARMVEKHFTLDRGAIGPDHKASIEPHEMRQMVQCIRNIEKAMGPGGKWPTPKERAGRAALLQRMEDV